MLTEPVVADDVRRGEAADARMRPRSGRHHQCVEDFVGAGRIVHSGICGIHVTSDVSGAHVA